MLFRSGVAQAGELDDLERRCLAVQIEDADGTEWCLAGDPTGALAVGRAPGVDEEHTTGERDRRPMAATEGDDVDGATELLANCFGNVDPGELRQSAWGSGDRRPGRLAQVVHRSDSRSVRVDDPRQSRHAVAVGRGDEHLTGLVGGVVTNCQDGCDGAQPVEHAPPQLLTNAHVTEMDDEVDAGEGLENLGRQGAPVGDGVVVVADQADPPCTHLRRRRDCLLGGDVVVAHLGAPFVGQYYLVITRRYLLAIYSGSGGDAFSKRPQPLLERRLSEGPELRLELAPDRLVVRRHRRHRLERSRGAVDQLAGE